MGLPRTATAIYSLTEVAIELVPVLAHLGAWGRRHFPVADGLAVRARIPEEGRPALWDDFMAELRERHLGIPAQPVLVELAQLQTAYETARKNAGDPPHPLAAPHRVPETA